MWLEIDNSLVKTFEFKDFSEAFSFMNLVAALVEKEDHHPWWSNMYNKVEIRLCTHSAGNIITEKDRILAKNIDKLING